MASREGINFLGALPVDNELVQLLDNEAVASAAAENEVDEGEASKIGSEEHAFALLERYQKTPTSKLFKQMSEKVLARLVELDAASE